jgi:hypothetical protein
MKSIHRAEWADLIFILAVFLGVFMRFNPALLAGFAINDGGMFAVMVDDLKTNHYLLPAFTTYNHMNIPFAYPPLGFYLGGLASDLLGLTAVQAVRWMPALFASIAIPAYYLLSLRLLKDKYYAALSTLFFAMMPRALWWFVMGGGLTRSIGQVFMLLTLATLVRLYEEHRLVDIFFAGFLGGLAVLSHPEAAVHTFFSAVFLWIMLSRRYVTFLKSALVGLIVFVFTAPWWATVVHYHGLEPFLNGVATGQKFVAVFHLLFFVFTEEPYATVIAILGLLGIGYHLLRRHYLLPVWMAIPFFVEGRSAAEFAAIPLAMLAAIGLVNVAFAGLGVLDMTKASTAAQESADSEIKWSDQVSTRERNVFIYLFLYLTFSTQQFGLQLSAAALPLADREAMNWIQSNTPEDSRFLVLTGTSSVACDAVLEWFPALTDRQSPFTVQGTEWTKGAKFSDSIRSTYAVQECLSIGEPACLDAAINRTGSDFIYVSKTLRVNNCKPLDFQKSFLPFVENMRKNPRFDAIYETEDVIVFRNR